MSAQAEKIVCKICAAILPSKTQLFKHLESHGYESLYSKPDKIVLLFGWLSQDVNLSEERLKDSPINLKLDLTADRIENDLFRAIYAVDNDLESLDSVPAIVDRPKALSRSSTITQRADYIIGIEPTVHGLCDTICFHASKRWTGSQDNWIEKVNHYLPHTIRVLDRLVLPASASDFHAFTSCTQRIYEYMMPLNIIMVNVKDFIAYFPSLQNRYSFQ